MLWTLSKTADEPSALAIPSGALWVMRQDNGQKIAIVWPQARRHDTHNVSALIERAPDVLLAVQHLDRVTHPVGVSPDDITIANAWRSLRRLTFGLEATMVGVSVAQAVRRQS